MIRVRRIYLYLVTLAALGMWSLATATVVRTVLEAWLQAPSATTPALVQDQLAFWGAAALIGMPVWAVHWQWSRRLCVHPGERASTLRRLFLYVALTGAVFVTWIALDQTLSALTLALVTGRLELARWAILPLPTLCVAISVWLYHWHVSANDRAAVGESGGSATLRRWYLYGLACVALIFFLDGTQTIVMTTWMRVTNTGALDGSGVSGVTNALIGLLVWTAHWVWLPARLDAEHQKADQHATLRSVYLFIALSVVLVGTLSGVSQALYYGLARALGVNTPAGVGGSLLTAAAGPVSVALVYGAAWLYQRRVIHTFQTTLDTPRQIGVRRIYDYLIALVALAVLALGLSGLLWMLGDIVTHAPDVQTGTWWRDRLSLFATLTIVGLPVWLLHWRAGAGGETTSLARRIYLYVSLIAAVLALLGSGAATLYRVFGLLLGSAQLDSAWVDLAHAAAVALVAAGLTAYQWRTVRGDSTVASEPRVEPARIVVELSATSSRVLDLALEALGEHGVTAKRRPA